MTSAQTRMSRLHRDDAISERVGAIGELRGFEVEFEVYGTAYWKDGMRHYLASGNTETLHQHVVALENQDCFPLPPQTWTERRMVPAGCDEEYLQQVKLNCCRHIRRTFPEEYWRMALEVAAGRFNDDGYGILEPLRDSLEGSFDADRLQMFDALVNRLYARRNLTPRSYRYFGSWLSEERNYMVENLAKHDVFKKDMYGFAYRGEGGRTQIIVDSVRETVSNRCLEIERAGNGVTTPLFKKTCWYNREYRLPQARKDFKIELEKLYDDAYFDLLARVDGLPVAVDEKAYRRNLSALQSQDNDALRVVWEDRGRQWGVLRVAAS